MIRIINKSKLTRINKIQKRNQFFGKMDYQINGKNKVDFQNASKIQDIPNRTVQNEMKKYQKMPDYNLMQLQDLKNQGFDNYEYEKIRDGVQWRQLILFAQLFIAQGQNEYNQGKNYQLNIRTRTLADMIPEKYNIFSQKDNLQLNIQYFYEQVQRLKDYLINIMQFHLIQRGFNIKNIFLKRIITLGLMINQSLLLNKQFFTEDFTLAMIKFRGKEKQNDFILKIDNDHLNNTKFFMDIFKIQDLALRKSPEYKKIYYILPQQLKKNTNYLSQIAHLRTTDQQAKGQLKLEHGDLYLYLNIVESKLDYDIEYSFDGLYKFRVTNNQVLKIIQNQKKILSDHELFHSIKLVGFKIKGSVLKYKNLTREKSSLNAADINDVVTFKYSKNDIRKSNFDSNKSSQEDMQTTEFGL